MTVHMQSSATSRAEPALHTVLVPFTLLQKNKAKSSQKKRSNSPPQHQNMSPQIYSSPPMAPTLKRTRSCNEPAPTWGSPKKIKTSLLGDDDVDSYDKPHDNFVLCGRGERTNRHPGNKVFRRVVEANRAQYHSGSRNNKALIARSIVEAIMRQDPPGKFVRLDKNSDLWVDIGMKESMKKTSQALREESLKESKTVEESKDDDEEYESSGSEEEELEDEKPPSPVPSQFNNYAHQQGFAKGTVSFDASEQEVHDPEPEDDAFDRMIEDLAMLEHDADVDTSSEPTSDLSASSSKELSDAPLQISLLYQSSIDSSAISVISQDTESPTGVEISKSIFYDGHGDDNLHHITNIRMV